MNRDRGGIDVTAIITYKNLIMVNEKPMTVSLNIGEGVAHNTIFSCTSLHTIKA